MKIKRSILSAVVAVGALIVSASAAAATYTVTETGSSTSNAGVTDSWSVTVLGEGILEITLAQADNSEWFEWSLSGDGSGSGEFSPVPWTGAVNASLGSWANAAGEGMFSFTSTNYVSGLDAQDYTIDFSFTPALLSPNPIDYITVTPTSAVPLPAAVWLFGSALLGLGVIKRKRA